MGQSETIEAPLDTPNRTRRSFPPRHPVHGLPATAVHLPERTRTSRRFRTRGCRVPRCTPVGQTPRTMRLSSLCEEALRPTIDSRPRMRAVWPTCSEKVPRGRKRGIQSSTNCKGTIVKRLSATSQARRYLLRVVKEPTRAKIKK